MYDVGSLTCIKGKMNQYMYKEILDIKLCETTEYMPIDERNIVFQYDRDPKYMAKSVQEWLKLQPYQVLDWSVQSPDLNPIENLWAILKQQLRNEYEFPPRNLDELWEKIEKQWYAIPLEVRKNSGEYAQTNYSRFKCKRLMDKVLNIYKTLILYYFLGGV